MKGFILVACCLVAVSQAMVLCPKDVCKNIKCDSTLTAGRCAANGGSLKPKGGFCGCCDVCLQELGEGEDCSSSMLIGVPATSKCAKDLECDFNSRQCRKPSCKKVLQQKNEILAKLPLPPLGFEKPTCAADGTYAGKQCVGSKCYCVNVNGKNLGYDHNKWDTDDKITCQCARDKAAYFARKIIGRLFHCSDKGDYESVQCTGSVCYCADRNTGKQVDSVKAVHISGKSSLSC